MWRIGGLVLLGIGVLGMVATGGLRGMGAATQAENVGKWEGVLRGLRSDSFAERERAQQLLDQTTTRDIQMLRGLAKDATDPEVKSRLEKRIAAIELEAMEHPAGVTVALKNAGVKEMSAAFSGATGVKWTAWERGAAGGPWTIEARERPLWEVFTNLEKQGAMHVQNSEGSVMLAAGPMVPGGMGPIDGGWTDVAVGDFLFYAGIARANGPFGWTAPGQAAVMGKLEFGMRGDPRLQLTRCAIPQILSVVDDKGNVLYTAPEGEVSWNFVTGRMSELNTGMGFQEAPGMGKSLTIKGKMAVLRATAIERVEIPLTGNASKPVVVGGRRWQMWAIDPLRDEGWVINVTEAHDGGAALDFVPLSVKVVDAEGKLVWDGPVDGQKSMRVQPGEVKMPLHAEIVAATETKEEAVVFEIKDVPVPAAGMR